MPSLTNFSLVWPNFRRMFFKTRPQAGFFHQPAPRQQFYSPPWGGGTAGDSLTWRLFFHDIKLISQRKNYQLRSRTVRKIHDRMHDIALSVMGKDCLNIGLFKRSCCQQALLATYSHHIVLLELFWMIIWRYTLQLSRHSCVLHMLLA